MCRKWVHPSLTSILQEFPKFSGPLVWRSGKLYLQSPTPSNPFNWNDFPLQYTKRTTWPKIYFHLVLFSLFLKQVIIFSGYLSICMQDLNLCLILKLNLKQVLFACIDKLDLFCIFQSFII